MTIDVVPLSPHILCAVRAAPLAPEKPGKKAFLSAVLTACHVEMERSLIQQVEIYSKILI